MEVYEYTPHIFAQKLVTRAKSVSHELAKNNAFNDESCVGTVKSFLHGGSKSEPLKNRLKYTRKS